MNARTLDKRITLQKTVITQDSVGQPEGIWEDVATIWTSVKFPSGKEYITADRETSLTKASFRIRRREINTQMRIIFDGDVYEIEAVLPDGTRFINIAAHKVE